MADWRKALLKSLSAPITPQNLKFLSGWQRWEGGHTNNTARWNWLNTTRGPGTSINSVGVKAFGDFQTGVRYTAETLLNGRYDDIVGGLMGGNPYARDLSAGLSTWVSGSPTGNLKYAQKVMGVGGSGGGGAPKAALYPGGRGPTGNPGLASPPPMPPLPEYSDDFLYDVWGDLAPLFKRMRKSRMSAVPGGSAGKGQKGRGYGTSFRGKTLVLPTQWKSTHVTDGLSEEGFQKAIDIMGHPGTPVGAPEAGRVVRWDPAGAQGGGSMWFQADNGRMYWIGHIANGLKPGTRVRRGQVIASISPDHPRPHVHLDRR